MSKERLVELYVSMILGDATQAEFYEACGNISNAEVDKIEAEGKAQLWACGIC